MDATKKAQLTKFFNSIEEGTAYLIIGAGAEEVGCTTTEAAQVYFEPYYDAYARRKTEIAESAGNCHYCGQKAKSYGAFDEPVCKECGG